MEDEKQREAHIWFVWFVSLFGSRSKINLEWERWFYVLNRKGAAQEFSEIAGARRLEV